MELSAALRGSTGLATSGSPDTAELILMEGRVDSSREATAGAGSDAGTATKQTSRHKESCKSSPSASVLSTFPPSRPGPSQDGEHVEHDKDKLKLDVTPSVSDHLMIRATAERFGRKSNDRAVESQPNIVLPSPCDTVPQSPQSSATAQGDFQPQIEKQRHQAAAHVVGLHQASDGAADSHDSVLAEKMYFGYPGTASAALRRRNYATTNALTDYEADLTSKDRAKQKEAVKKYLSERVKQDWAFEWPPADIGSVEQLNPSSEIPDLPSLPGEDVPTIWEEQWRERDEWLSNASESGDDRPIPTTATSPDTPSTRHSPFQFESPDTVGDTVKHAQYERKRRRKRRLVDEMTWNDGLRCFTTRRDIWTCARRVPKTGLHTSASRTQRGSLSTEGSSTAIEQEEDEEWEDDVEVPIALPIIPIENAMRASIQPGAYHTIYDKVIVQQLTPSCPMNLKDITRSCVQGWKRDGEWPPKATVPDAKRKSRKMSVASLFSLQRQKTREQDRPRSKGQEVLGVGDQEKGSGPEVGLGGEKKSPSGIRKSLQKMLGLGYHKDGAALVHGDINKTGGVGS